MLSQVKMYSKSLNACHTKIGPLKIGPTIHLAENLPTLDLWSTFSIKIGPAKSILGTDFGKVICQNYSPEIICVHCSITMM